MGPRMMWLLTLAVCGCGGGSTGPSDKTPTETGDLVVTLTRAPGTSTLLFSASVRVGNGSPFRVTDWDEHTVSGLTTGTHLVEATDPTTNCVIQGAPSKAVSIVASQVTQVSFQINCTFQAQPRIVFDWRQPVWESDIWTVNPDGTNLQQLTKGEPALVPKWSPDGTRILFSGNSIVLVMNFDGTEERIVFNLGQTPASWTGDGKKIGFIHKASPRTIWTINLDGTDLTQLDEGPEDRGWPAWSHDNQKIVFCEENHLTLIDASGGSSVRLAEDFGPLGCEAPVWSPDDQEIAFSRRGDIWRIGVDGTGLTRLAVGGGFAYPAYASGGTSIIFHSGSASPQPAERAWIMDVDGGNLRRFTALPGIGVQRLRWWQP